MNLAIDVGFCSGWADRPSERGCTCEKEGWGVGREEIERERVRERSLKGDWGDGSVHSGAGAYHKGLSCEILR